MKAATSVLDKIDLSKAPKIEGVTPAQRFYGRRLAMIHRLHLEQIAEVEAVISQIEASREIPAKAAEAVTKLEMIASHAPEIP